MHPATSVPASPSVLPQLRSRAGAVLGRVPGWLLTVAVVLCVAGARLWLIFHYSSDQPFHDQWTAEGFYRNWFDGNLEWRIFFYPHSEHRPALTRLLAMAEFWLNGQWDARLQMVVNLGIYLLAVGTLVEFARRHLSARGALVVGLVAIVLFAQPANYENALWGFQSQFYLLLLLGAWHVLGSMRERLDWYWFLAQGAGLLGLFSMAAGVMSASAVWILSVFDVVRGENRRRAIVTLVVNTLLIAIAWWSFPAAPVAHEARVQSLSQFLAAFAYLLAWPLPSWWGAVLIVPWCWFAVRRQEHSAHRGLVALGLWCGLMIAAFAFGRGSSPGTIAVRYQDVLTVALFVSATAVVSLWSNAREHRRIWAVAAVLWLTLLGAGCWRVNCPEELGRVLGEWRDYFVRQQTVVREFLATDDEQALAKDPLVRSFLPQFELARDLLRDPRMRARLSPSLVPPLELRRDADRSVGFEASSAQRVFSPTADLPREQHYVSEPVERVGMRVLRFRVRGAADSSDAGLWLERSDGSLVPPLGTVASGTRWKTINFMPGEDSVRVVARGESGSAFAFTAPIEVGTLSWLIPKVLSSWLHVLVAGGACLLLASLAAWRAGRWRSD